MSKISTRVLVRAGLIGALYAVISLAVAPVSSGPIQVRISEGLTLLAVIFPESVFGLSIGCLITNLITACAPFDVLFGTLITLVSAVLSYFCTRKITSKILKILVGGVFPVTLNAFFLPLVWIWCYGAIEYVYFIQALILLLGQALSVYLVGTPVYLATEKLKKKGVKFLN